MAIERVPREDNVQSGNVREYINDPQVTILESLTPLEVLELQGKAVDAIQTPNVWKSKEEFMIPRTEFEERGWIKLEDLYNILLRNVLLEEVPTIAFSAFQNRVMNHLVLARDGGCPGIIYRDNLGRQVKTYVQSSEAAQVFFSPFMVAHNCKLNHGTPITRADLVRMSTES